MKLYSIEVNGLPKLSVKGLANELYLLEDLGYSYNDINEFIEHTSDEDLTYLKDMLSNNKFNDCTKYSLESVKILSPVSKPKQDIVCLGVNYLDHAKELTKTESINSIRSINTIYFSKRANYVVGDGGYIKSHSDVVSQLDYEVELAVILKKDAYKVLSKDALDYIFGYSIINDISARDLQSKHKQWYLGKSLDGFTAIGPCIVTADEIENPQSLNIFCTVNGNLRQNSNTSLMIQSIGSAIEELTTGMTLEAGTIIATGTPSGVGKGMTPPQYLKHGDVVSCNIENIGTLTNTID